MIELERGRREGCTLHELNESLVALYKPQEVAASMDWLLHEGHAYSTIDDMHFRSTVMLS